MLLTVFTPTFNRSLLLERLYRSLVAQSSKDFEWVIVDDGSKDNTEDLVKRYSIEGIISISYIKQNNKGKHVAFNEGVQKSKGEYFLCVDSDDWLEIDAIYKMKSFLRKMNYHSNGIIALKGYENGELIGDPFPLDIKVSNLLELNNVYHCRGERTLVFKTSILKQFKFPVFENEKFMTECVLYDQLDMLYKFHLFNEPITICEYQKDGLSSNLRRLQIDNPKGTAYFYKKRAEYSEHLFEKFSYKLREYAFIYLSKKRDKTEKITLIPRILGGIISRYYILRVFLTNK